MFKRMLLCGALAMAALFSSQLSAAEELCVGKELAGVSWNFNVGIYGGCPGSCYGPYYGPYYGPCYYGCGPCYVPYPGPYYYGCRPCPPYWGW